MDRYTLIPATFCFLLAFAHTMYAFGAGTYRQSRFNLGCLSVAMVFQTLFLTLRGHQLGRCPLTNLFEVLIFLNWSMVLLYLIVGPAFRLSLLGAFTAPLVFALQLFALLMPIDTTHSAALPANPWLEMHAAVSVIAYGAFALAGVAGVMYLAQERQLKTHHIRSIFYHLPPISELALAIRRLMLWGTILLTAGLLAGFAVGHPGVKIAWGIAMWLLYAVILQAAHWRQLSPRRVAWFAVGAFLVSLVSLWWISTLPGGRA